MNAAVVINDAVIGESYSFEDKQNPGEKVFMVQLDFFGGTIQRPVDGAAFAKLPARGTKVKAVIPCSFGKNGLRLGRGLELTPVK